MTLPPLDVQSLLRSNHLEPRKGLGQNFLTNPGILDKVVEAAGVMPEDSVLEIGPGLGSLTRHLAKKARQVTSVEIDENLIPILNQVLDEYPNVRVIHSDILNLDPVDLMGTEPFVVVANIPYYITSAILRHLLEAGNRPHRLTLTVQREVADRICASPGDMSLLALSVQVYGDPHPVLRIPAGAFFPPPKVDSVTLRVDLLPQPRIPTDRLNEFFRLAKAGFSQKRKTLRNSLSGGMGWKPVQAARILQSAGIEPQRRAETLSLEEWGRLTAEFLEEKTTSF